MNPVFKTIIDIICLLGASIMVSGYFGNIYLGITTFLILIFLKDKK